jgi:coenzyme F420-reducing hydrogenase beta subunit
MADVSFGDVWSVLKWVLVVLAAGFIGQFGRHAAQRLLERRGEAHQHSLSGLTPLELEAKLEKKRLKARLKAEKKRAKAEAKRAKKS